jgi:hypothetical protein
VIRLKLVIYWTLLCTPVCESSELQKQLAAMSQSLTATCPAHQMQRIFSKCSATGCWVAAFRQFVLGQWQYALHSVYAAVITIIPQAQITWVAVSSSRTCKIVEHITDTDSNWFWALRSSKTQFYHCLSNFGILGSSHLIRFILILLVTCDWLLKVDSHFNG